MLKQFYDFNDFLLNAGRKIMTHHNNVTATNAAIDAASPFGPVASTFARNPDNPTSAYGVNTGTVMGALRSDAVQDAAYNAAEAASGFIEGVSSKMSEARDLLGDIFDRPTSAPAVSGSRLNPETLDYLNADLARSYGMDRTTAYQEALSNTSYQRAVKDMQAAGLNPAALFGNGRVSGAGGVAYASPAGSGGSGSGFGGKSASAKLFSEGTYAGISTAAGIAAAAITGNVNNYWLASSAAKGVMTAMNGISKVF